MESVYFVLKINQIKTNTHLNNIPMVNVMPSCIFPETLLTESEREINQIISHFYAKVGDNKMINYQIIIL